MTALMAHPKADQVLDALRAAGWTIGRLARAVGLNKQSVYNWLEKGTLPHDEGVFDTMLRAIPKVPEPNARVIPLRDAHPAVQSLAEGQIALLPVWRAQGGIIGDEEFSFDEQELETIGVPGFLVTGAPIEKFRAVVVSGFSMSPRIESGALVVVRLVDEAASGVITVVQADAGRLFVKTFRRDSYGNPELHSINGKYPPIEAVQLRGWRVRAVACGIVHAYEPGRANIEWDAGRPLRA